MKTALFLLCIFMAPFSAFADPGVNTSGQKAMFNIMDFGATGDGMSDDSDAVQKAIDAADKAGGGIVLFPAVRGNYKIDRKITVKSNITLTGERGYSSVFLYNGYFEIAGHHSVTIEKLNIVGQERKVPCIRTYSSANPTNSDIKIRGNRFAGCKFGIYSAHWMQNVIIDNNEFTDSDYGLYVHTIDNWQITDNTFTAPIVRPIEIHNGHNNLVRGNKIEGDKKGTIIGILFATNTTLPTDGPSNNVVTGNTVKHIAEEGIMMEETVANAFKAGGTAIGATSRTLTQLNAGWKINSFAGREVILADGTGAGQWRDIISNTEDAITLDRDWKVIPDNTTKFTIVKLMKGNVISNNSVEDTGRMGIEFYGPSADNTISGNIVRNGGTNKDYSGIAIVGTAGQGGKREARHPAINNTVTGNTISGPAKAGIHVYVQQYVKPDFWNMNNSILENVVNASPTGILIEQSKHTIIDRNTISSVDIGIRESSSSDDTVARKNIIKDYKTADILRSSGAPTLK